ncbi:hypothetical protein EMGBS4_06520 [Acidimicrobiaceae bacterium]|nr:hypothetical protein EMGBS4_06520 [Acidimicrobiaceae bacterium]
MSNENRITKLANRPLNEPNESRLSPDDRDYELIISAHEEALARGADGYIDPISSLFVITAATLKARGFCCVNNCRHCPYI